jgi:hypothetical protein
MCSCEQYPGKDREQQRNDEDDPELLILLFGGVHGVGLKGWN